MCACVRVCEGDRERQRRTYSSHVGWRSRIELNQIECFFITSLPIELILNDFCLTTGSHLLMSIVDSGILEAISFSLVTPTYLN